jgi:hypothetical protein
MKREVMQINISKKTQTIFAVNKKTGDKKSVNLLSIGERRFNCSDDDWGIWHNYSKRGDWELYIET